VTFRSDKGQPAGDSGPVKKYLAARHRSLVTFRRPLTRATHHQWRLRCRSSAGRGVRSTDHPVSGRAARRGGAGRIEIGRALRVRAEFIASCGWGEREDIEAAFRERGAALKGSATEDEVVLWFESDLYDHLQLCQVLAHYRDESPLPERLWLVCVDRNPQDGKFRGLGQCSPTELLTEYAQSCRGSAKADRLPSRGRECRTGSGSRLERSGGPGVAESG